MTAPILLRMAVTSSGGTRHDIAHLDAGAVLVVTQGAHTARFTVSGPTGDSNVVIWPGAWSGDPLGSFTVGSPATVALEQGPADGSVLALAGGKPAWQQVATGGGSGGTGPQGPEGPQDLGVTRVTPAPPVLPVLPGPMGQG